MSKRGKYYRTDHELILRVAATVQKDDDDDGGGGGGGVVVCVVYVDAGVGVVEVSVDGPARSSDPVTAAVNQQTDDVWLVQYTPLAAGPHTVNVYYGGQHISYSPFTAHVTPRQCLCLSLSLSRCVCVSK